MTVEDHDEPKTAEEVDRNLPGSFSPLTETEAPRRPLPPKRLPSKCKPVTHQGGHPTALPGQKSLLVEEGTVVFVSPPGVRELALPTSCFFSLPLANLLTHTIRSRVFATI